MNLGTLVFLPIIIRIHALEQKSVRKQRNEKKRSFKPSIKVLRVGDSYYHAACFTCTECGVSLSKGGKAADGGGDDDCGVGDYSGGWCHNNDGGDSHISYVLMMTRGDITLQIQKTILARICWIGSNMAIQVWLWFNLIVLSNYHFCPFMTVTLKVQYKFNIPSSEPNPTMENGTLWFQMIVSIRSALLVINFLFQYSGWTTKSFFTYWLWPNLHPCSKFSTNTNSSIMNNEYRAPFPGRGFPMANNQHTFPIFAISRATTLFFSCNFFNL